MEDYLQAILSFQANHGPVSTLANRTEVGRTPTILACHYWTWPFFFFKSEIIHSLSTGLETVFASVVINCSLIKMDYWAPILCKACTKWFKITGCLVTAKWKNSPVKDKIKWKADNKTSSLMASDYYIRALHCYYSHFLLEITHSLIPFCCCYSFIWVIRHHQNIPSSAWGEADNLMAAAQMGTLSILTLGAKYYYKYSYSIWNP